MSPSKNTTSPHDPDHGASASRMGYFPILGEGVLLLLSVFVAIRFFSPDGRPELVGWVLLVFAALLLVDIVRRTLRAIRINRKELT